MMGNNADDYMSDKRLAGIAGKNFRYANHDIMDSLTANAEDLAASDGMSFQEAIKILSGNSRKPYGSPKP